MARRTVVKDGEGSRQSGGSRDGEGGGGSGARKVFDDI